MNEEFLELFGDISAYAKVINRLAEECDHKDFTTTKEGSNAVGYCKRG